FCMAGGASRALPSFPTRRSSDLVIGRVTEQVIVPSFQRGEATPALLLGGGLVILGIAVARAVTVMARRVFAAAAQFDLFGLYREDRKSTRLNSSHASISYAVFRW